MSDCHSSARCDEHQRIILLSGNSLEATVHNVHEVKGYSKLFGFIHNKKGHRVEVNRMMDDSTWQEYQGLGL